MGQLPLEQAKQTQRGERVALESDDLDDGDHWS